MSMPVGSVTVGMSYLPLGVLADPVQNPGVGLFVRLPKEAMGLPRQHFQFGVGDALGQDLRLVHVVRAPEVVITDHDQSWWSYLSKAVGGIPRMAGDADTNVLGPFRMSAPSGPVHGLHLLRMIRPKIVREVGLGFTHVISDKLLEAALLPGLHPAPRHSRHAAVSPLGCRPGAARRQDKALYPTRKVQRQAESNPPADGMAQHLDRKSTR